MTGQGTSSARSGALGLAMILLLAACATGPDYVRPKASVPDHFAFDGEDATATPDEKALAQWWTAFDDPMLVELVERAQRASPDVAIAAARIAKARAQLASADAVGLPKIDAAVSGNITRLSENGGLSTLASAFGGGAAGGSGQGGNGTGSGAAEGIGVPGTTFESYSAGFDASWEPDLFGFAEKGRAAARAAYDASVYARQGAITAVAGEVARSYFAYRSLAAQAALAHAQAAAQARRLALQENKVRAGLASGDTLPPFAIAVEQARADADRLAGQRDGTVASIATMVDAPTQEILTALSNRRFGEWEVPMIPPGTPAALLRRRPDIFFAEAQLASATAQIGVAKADLFPRLSLSGIAEFLSGCLVNLFAPDSIQLSASGRLGFPILDFGAGKAKVASAEADARIAYFQYQKQVLTALEDVEQALVERRSAIAQRQRLAAAVGQQERSLSAAEAAYAAGLTDGDPVIRQQAALAQAKSALIQADAASATASAALYKALGGGWNTVIARRGEEPNPPGEGAVEQPEAQLGTGRSAS